ncbi:protein quiver [Galendromus occidentalis]|uniref:Protein quiver n=1 Tax=Galendromus occidentalis TaxID=34638 RepID=A0AAJ7SGR5_9ACAR|nr:protein quiver [Galendromus occidentalis]
MICSYASCFFFRLLLVAAAVLSSSVCYRAVFAEEECINKGVLCYNCDSTLDPNCADPWNFTGYYDIGVPIQKCVGSGKRARNRRDSIPSTIPPKTAEAPEFLRSPGLV